MQQLHVQQVGSELIKENGLRSDILPKGSPLLSEEE